MSTPRISRCRLASVSFLVMTFGLLIMAIWPWWKITYEARATMMAIRPSDASPFWISDEAKGERVKQILRSAKSDELIDRAVVRLQRDDRQAVREILGISKEEVEDYVNDHSKPVLIFRTTVFYFEAWGSTPDQAATLANVLADEMIYMTHAQQIGQVMPIVDKRRVEVEELQAKVAALDDAAKADDANLSLARQLDIQQSELIALQSNLLGMGPDVRIIEAAKPTNADRMSYRREYALASALCLLLAGVFCRMGWFGRSVG